jgi:tuberous sclerosis 2
MEYKAARISATRPKWLESLNAFIDRFYKMNNTNIRVFAVQSLMKIMEINRAAYEEEILERVVTLYFPSIAHEKDLAVKKVVVKLLIDFASYCDNKRCLELLDIAEKMMNRPFESYLLDGSVVKSETDVEDIDLLIDGLIKVFQLKLYRLPSSHAVRVFHILVGHMEQHYQKPSVFEKATKIRYKIFNWMLKARANASFHIGYPDAVTGLVRFSNYLGIEGSLQMSSSQSQMQQSASGQLEVTPAANFTAISIRRGCKCIVKCMDIEKSWVVLQLVLKELPNILQNKALIQGNDVDLLARTLYNLVSTFFFNFAFYT